MCAEKEPSLVPGRGEGGSRAGRNALPRGAKRLHSHGNECGSCERRRSVEAGAGFRREERKAAEACERDCAFLIGLVFGLRKVRSDKAKLGPIAERIAKNATRNRRLGTCEENSRDVIEGRPGFSRCRTTTQQRACGHITTGTAKIRGNFPPRLRRPPFGLKIGHFLRPFFRGASHAGETVHVFAVRNSSRS